MRLDFGFFNWQLVQSFIVKGLIFSVELTIVAMIGGIALGTLLALMRLSNRPWLVNPAAAYVNTLRSIPLVMVILWFFLLIPGSFYQAIPGGLGTRYRSEIAALITFTVFEAAYYSEIMRAGIQSVAKGQVYAGYAVGMTYAQCMKLIVLPQAFRNMLPVLLTQTIILFQDTSLVYVISATDFLGAAAKIANRDYRLVEMYSFAAVVYFVISFGLSLVVKRLQVKIAVIR
jgi:glutamate/aspartate transport system permease protein